MDVQAHIESGILELYCLGELPEEEEAYVIQMTMLYPEIKAALNTIELALERWAEANALEPREELRGMVLSAIGYDDIGKLLDPENLPRIGYDTDPDAWLNTFAHLVPDEPTGDFTLHVIRKDENIQQMLVISKVEVPEEEHGEYLESFYILKGTCECMVGEKHYALGPGDFIEIPLHTPHNINVTSPHVVAILQYEFV